MNDIDRRFLLGGLAGAAGVTALGAMARGGPINPPAGAVAGSGKTLTEVEPRIAINATNTPGDATAVYVISQPGSYMLTGNITGVSGRHGIKISAGDVTLDLNGFKIGGVAGSLDGINATSTNRNVAVRNGVIADFGGGGINNNGSNFCCFSDLQLYNNALGGLATGSDALVERVSVKAGTVGISVGDRSRVTACEVTGIVSGGPGIFAGYNCVLLGCAAVSCSGPCIDAANGSLVRDCNGSGSATSHGIRINYGGSVVSCIANSNFVNGIEAVQRNRVIDCTATGNTQSGIHANFAAHVQGNFCDSNAVCGIFTDAGGGVTIRGNTCLENGLSNSGAGIRVASVGSNVIEGNAVSVNYRGIDVLSTRNMIIGNRAAFNTNNDYAIVAGNTYGPIVNTVGVGDIIAITNANHPQANFRF